MLNRSDIERIILDFFRTETARTQADALAVFETQSAEDFFAQVSPAVAQTVFEKTAIFFGYSPRPFSSLDLMTDYAYASFLKNQQIVFLTSGSTGTPKQCPHSADMIAEEAYGVATEFEGVKRIISLVPSNHLYGFSFTVALPHALKIPVISMPALPTQPWNTLLQEGDLVVGFPLFWKYFLKCKHTFPPGVSVLTSTAPCKDEVIEGLYTAGAKKLTEIYGASEMGAMARRNHAKTPFELFPFWEISLLEDQPQIKRKSQEKWSLLPDQVEIVSERTFFPVKRTDACVQVAGINVYPKHTEEVLREHPAVKDCRVRLMRPDEGERLKAFIVLNEGFTQETLSDIRAFLSQKLTVHEVPRAFSFGEQLPVSALGKDADW